MDVILWTKSFSEYWTPKIILNEEQLLNEITNCKKHSEQYILAKPVLANISVSLADVPVDRKLTELFLPVPVDAEAAPTATSDEDLIAF